MLQKNYNLISSVMCDNSSIFEIITKSIIKSLSNSRFLCADSCFDIVMGNYRDEIVNDLIQEVTLAILENEKTEYTIDEKGHIDFGTYETVNKNGETMDRPFYHDLLKVVSNYLYRNKSICANNTPIDTYEKIEEGETVDYISANDRKNYINAIRCDLQNDENIMFSINDFKTFVTKNYPKISDELNTFIDLLSYGNDIKTIADIMGISDSRAYYLSKTIKQYYSEGTKKVPAFNPIERKKITFAPIVTDNGIHYKRVNIVSAKMTIAGKTHNVKTMVTPSYTVNENRFNKDSKRVETVKQIFGNIPIIEDEIAPKKRNKEYVINMTKKAQTNHNDGCTYRKSDCTLAGSYNFCYADTINGKPQDDIISIVPTIEIRKEGKKKITIRTNKKCIGFYNNCTYTDITIQPKGMTDALKDRKIDDKPKTMLIDDDTRKWLKKNLKKQDTMLNHDKKCFHGMDKVKAGSFYF